MTSPSSPEGERRLELLTPFRLGDLELPHRAVMAPMTRNRAGEGDVPTPMNATYYAQRSGAALIVSEGSPVSPRGVGYPRTPGIHTDEQVAGWRRVTGAVHRAGGRIFLQLWHVGRVSHPLFQPGGELPVAPSALRPAGKAYTPEGKRPFVTPRPLDAAEIPGIVEAFRKGAEGAREAGFDGVEIHAANGYLIDQFLRDGTNHRTDRYGGSPAGRVRFLLEVTEAVLAEWESARVGVRVSPLSSFNDMADSDPAATFSRVARELAPLELAYLHVVESVTHHPPGKRLTPVLRRLFGGPLIANGDHDLESAEAVLSSGVADLVAFGRLYLANPDLPERFRRGATLNEPDPSTFYGGGREGYLDYPTLGELEAHRR